jgi:hypothetical protein
MVSGVLELCWGLLHCTNNVGQGITQGIPFNFPQCEHELEVNDEIGNVPSAHPMAR